MLYVGIDPGISGAAALLSNTGEIITVVAFKNLTHKDTSDLLKGWRDQYSGDGISVMLEKVHAFPGRGSVSTWKFAEHYGFLQGVVTSLELPLEYVTPQRWQKRMGCLTKGDKNVSKAAAQRLWPKTKCTHATSDAILVAEYNRLVHIDEIFT
jgi:crossover junction endodeoxyribonuclease RuvC